ncbi:metallophosphoesterase [Sphingomonas sp. SRS2]|uniref:metallophosphoesterase n=1 Tax=Sphingomonas sp. SRS2 TaxID=133190 RepID=UPI0006184B8E|nr:metallophosphoesterase [Sphingomonas sp. SRS2]KKC25426.1 hypothetical protein WP12_14395 [Sphingomonas sp. SRS2]
MRLTLTIIAGGWLLLIYMLLLAGSEPVVRHFQYSPGPESKIARKQRIILLTDIHVAGPDMPPERLAQIVETINKLRPDIILLGGDFVSASKLITRRYDIVTALRPIGSLRASLGIIAVLGNHDHWLNAVAVQNELSRLGITTLDNHAVRRGDISIGGVDDDFTAQADIHAVARELKSLGGVPILLSHSPDIFPATPTFIGLVLAGHTHCGQISLPIIGPIFTASHHGRRFTCGLIKNGDQQMIVSAGVGTSILPLRLGAAPDLWVIDILPHANAPERNHQ